jgi:hypothetical protein
LDKLGSIWGGSAFKFGIYSRNSKEKLANVGGRTYSDNYAWMVKYGNSEEEAFASVKANILETIDAVTKNEIEKIDQIDLGNAYKWKIAYHYQESLEKPICINIFKRSVLEAASKSPHGSPRSLMQRKLVKEWPGSDFIKYAQELWKTYSKDIPPIPEILVPEEPDANKPEEAIATNEHTEIQYLLLRLGSDMGFDVWAARNDKNKQFDGKPFSEIPRIKEELPLQFDEQTNRIIQNIDVLWIERNSFKAAFEIESTTSIYSGLLRMSDLITMQPNLSIPLFLVAPDDRRLKVIQEINRSTFTRLNLPEICRYISFSKLKTEIANIKNLVRYLKPKWLEEISESCTPDEL